MTRRRLRAPVLVVLLAAACGGDEGSEDAAPTQGLTSDVTASTVPLEFEGDPDSEFCQRSRQAADEPVLDPFEAGLEPREVELRFRALTQRFEGFAEVAPGPLADDLTLLDETFHDLAVVLDDADYDFAQLAEAGIDVVAEFDDPALGVVADRVEAYKGQVCDP